MVAQTQHLDASRETEPPTPRMSPDLYGRLRRVLGGLLLTPEPTIGWIDLSKPDLPSADLEPFVPAGLPTDVLTRLRRGGPILHRADLSPPNLLVPLPALNRIAVVPVPEDVASIPDGLLQTVQALFELWQAELLRQESMRFTAEVIDELQRAPHESLPERLQRLAGQAGRIYGITGSVVVAVEVERLDGEAHCLPLAFGTHGLQLEASNGSPLQVLGRIADELQGHGGGTGPVQISPAHFAADSGGRLLGIPILYGGNQVGFLCAACSPSIQECSLETLKLFAAMLNLPIREAIQGDLYRRVQQLQQLIPNFRPEGRAGVGRRELTSEDFRQIVGKVRQIFAADVVTLFLEDNGALRLSTSTDQALCDQDRGSPVIYPRDLGLTGWVFRNAKSLRLSNSLDREEVRRRVDIDREAPLFPEHAVDGSQTCQFMAVPLRRGNEVVGVLRMSRIRGTVQFTPEDESALSFFGDLLGTLIADQWELRVARSIWEATTESIIMSRARDDSGYSRGKRIVRANPGAEKLYGRSAADLCNTDVKELYAPTSYAEVQQGLLAARASGKNEFGPIHSTLRRAQADDLPAELSFRLISDVRFQQPIRYTLGIGRLNERHQENERFRVLVESLDLVYFCADGDGRTLWSSPFESRLTGYSPDELRQMSRARLYADPRHRDLLLGKARLNKGRIYKDVAKFRRKDGSIFYVEGDLRIVYDSRGAESGVEGIYREVTDRLRLQNFLNTNSDRIPDDTYTILEDAKLFALLKKNATFQLDYLIAIGHQLKSPLSSVLGHLDNIDKGYVPEEQFLKRVKYLTSQITMCVRLVDNLSYMEQILRREPFTRRPVSMRQLAIESAVDFDAIARAHNFEFVLDFKSSLTVQGHKDLLKQVLFNLVDNAIKYSRPGTVISMAGRDAQTQTVVDIINEGLVISQADRKRIFERGVRTNHAMTSRPGGTGLGLWLVKLILEAHEASVECLEDFTDGVRRNVFRLTFNRSIPTE